MIPIFSQELPTKKSSFFKWNFGKAGQCQTSHFNSVQIFVWNWKVLGLFGKALSKVIIQFRVIRKTLNITSLYIFRIELSKVYFKEVCDYLSFVLEYPKPSIPQTRAKPSESIKMSTFFFSSISVSKFSTTVDVADWCFKPPGYQCKASVTLRLIAQPQKDSRNSILVSILKEMYWCYKYTR